MKHFPPISCFNSRKKKSILWYRKMRYLQSSIWAWEMKNGKLIMDNYYTEFEEQLKEKEKPNALIAKNLGKVETNG